MIQRGVTTSTRWDDLNRHIGQSSVATVLTDLSGAWRGSGRLSRDHTDAKARVMADRFSHQLSPTNPTAEHPPPGMAGCGEGGASRCGATPRPGIGPNVTPRTDCDLDNL